MSTNSINKFFINHGKIVYKNSGKIRRGRSRSPSNPTRSFKKEQRRIPIARNLQKKKDQLKRASSPTPNGLRRRKNLIYNTQQSIIEYNNNGNGKNGNGKNGNGNNDNGNNKNDNRSTRCSGRQCIISGGTKHKRTHKKRNRTKRN
jgi:hypothetical protein